MRLCLDLDEQQLQYVSNDDHDDSGDVICNIRRNKNIKYRLIVTMENAPISTVQIENFR